VKYQQFCTFLIIETILTKAFLEKDNL